MKYPIYILIGVGLLVGPVSASMPGNGTPDDPYQVSTLEHLQSMAADLNAHYVLVNDIDASATAEWNEVSGVYRGFAPVGDILWDLRFRGSFDGQGHRIHDLYINRPDQARVGLFGYIEVGSTVQNLGVVNATVIGGQRTGALAGENHGLISRAFSTGFVQGAWATGGLAGENAKSGVIENAYSHAAVQLSGAGGGLVGSNRGIVRYSFSTGEISGPAWALNGLIGDSKGGKVESSFWDTETSGITVSKGGEGKTTAEMYDLLTFASLDIADPDDYDGHTWVIEPGESYPTFGWEYINTIPVESDVFAWPEASSITYGDSLDASVLTGGAASVDGVFGFFASATVPAAAGVHEAVVVFTPADLDSYLAVTGTLTVAVNPRPLTVTGSFTAEDKVYDGTTDAIITQDSLSLMNRLSGDDVELQPTASFESPEPGTHTVSLTSSTYVTGTDASNYILSMADAPVTTATITQLRVVGRPVQEMQRSGLPMERAYLEWVGSASPHHPPTSYVIQSTTNIVSPDWKTVAVIPRKNGVNSWTSPDPVEGSVYYRVKVPGPGESL